MRSEQTYPDDGFDMSTPDVEYSIGDQRRSTVPQRSPLKPLSSNTISEHHTNGGERGVTAFIDGLIQKKNCSGACFPSWKYLINMQYKIFCSSNGYPCVDEEEFHAIRKLFRPAFHRLKFNKRSKYDAVDEAMEQESFMDSEASLDRNQEGFFVVFPRLYN